MIGIALVVTAALSVVSDKQREMLVRMSRSTSLPP
jgi:hypothetical protein